MKNAVNRALVAKRRLFLAFVLCTLSLCPLFSQEAFYIYRNDGNFNGFFYDEVVQMSYSKLGLDSVEYEQYVTYEVELADTIYRIPLASIDSIGFQQPEIKFNPRVKFIDKDGYAPYLAALNMYHGCNFTDLPANMMPQVGDVFIGLSNDSRAEELYGREDGSFAFVVDELDGWTYEENGRTVTVTQFKGHQVDKLSDVFEQFVMLEQIGLDQQGNIVQHRVSGKMPKGFPEPKRIAKASDEGEATIIDFSGTLTRTWNPSSNSNIELSAEIGVKVKLRVAYNISWTRMMVTLSNDVITTVKPAIAASVSASFEGRVGDGIPIPGRIKLPVQCPIFEMDPSPDIFLRTEGKLEARLNLPQVRLGVGVHYGIDTDNLFPVTCGLHLVPDEEKEVKDNMLDISGGVTLQGYAQAGLKFQAELSTNSWIKKIFYGTIGLYLYAGPKLGGQVTIASGAFDVLNKPFNEQDNSLYHHLTGSYLYLTAMSLDLEAKATASVMWRDPVEKKFFDKNWSFGSDTLGLALRIDSIVIDHDDDKLETTFRVHPHKQSILGYTKVGLGFFDTYYNLKEQVADWTFEQPYGIDTVFSYKLKDMDWWDYEAVSVIPIITCGQFGPFALKQQAPRFMPPFVLNAETDSLVFGAHNNLTQNLQIKTNFPYEKNVPDCVMQWITSGCTWTLPGELEAVDAANGMLQFVITSPANTTLFDRRISKTDPKHAYIGVLYNSTIPSSGPFGIYQAAPDLSGAQAYVSCTFRTSSGYKSISFNGGVTAQRAGDDDVEITGVAVSGAGTSEITTTTISFTIHREYQYNTNSVEQKAYCRNGRLSSVTVSGTGSASRTTTTVAEFSEIQGWIGDEVTISGSGLTSGYYEYEDEGSSPLHEDMIAGSDGVSGTLSVPAQ